LYFFLLFVFGVAEDNFEIRCIDSASFTFLSLHI